jgi:hypothetical protein
LRYRKLAEAPVVLFWEAFHNGTALSGLPPSPGHTRIQLQLSNPSEILIVIRYIFLALAAALVLPLPLPCQDQRDLRQFARDAGIIFSGTVEKIERVAPVPGDVGTVRVTFRIADALRGATPGEALTISEWNGLWNAGDRYRVGEQLLLFLYPPSADLGLTTTVGGERGRIRVADSHLSISALARQIGVEPVPIPGRRKGRAKLRAKLRLLHRDRQGW